MSKGYFEVYKNYKSKFENPKDFQRLSDNLTNKGWVYRGQTNTKWPLETTIYRHFHKFQTNHSLFKIESSLITEFKSKYHLYENRFPIPKSNLEWLSIMQHYGAPTRLLDFSHSIYIALYFACLDSSTTGALWMVNTDKIKDSIKFPRLLQTDEYILEGTINLENPRNKSPEFGNIIIPYTPSLSSNRLSHQQGTFLIPSNPKTTFMECLANNFNQHDIDEWNTYNEDFINLPRSELLEKEGNDWTEATDRGAIFKIEIPAKIKEDIKSILKDANVRTEILFPDLQGLGKSLYDYKPR